MSDDAGAGPDDHGPVDGPEEEGPVTGAVEEETDTESDDEGPGTWPTSMPQPGKTDLKVWVAIALMGCLVLLLLFANVPGMRANAGSIMTKTEWQLQSYVDRTGIVVPALSDPAVTAQFGRDGSVTGNSGCNRYAATYSTKDYTLNITNLAGSVMYCMEPGVMAQEQAYLADLTSSTDFRLTDSSLKMFSKTGKPLLVFVARS
jgi:heat shock protein HslJ